jgi:hypothetical protein
MPFQDLTKRRKKQATRTKIIAHPGNALFQWPSDFRDEILKKPPRRAIYGAMIEISALGGSAMKRNVLIVAGLALAIVGIRLLLAAPEWFKQRRENRQFIAVNNLTPERLLARCGQPLADETKNLYPIVARDISYQSEAHSTVVLKFSKTAEEASDWVFMSMQDSARGTEYETPTAKIAALSCLDSSK